MLIKTMALSSILIMSACGHSNKKNQNNNNEDLVSYFNEWKKDLNPQNAKEQEYSRNYQNYLTSVKDIFSQNGVENQFDLYLSTLRNNNELLIDVEESVATNYLKEKGRRPSSNKKDFELYKTNMMTSTSDRLNEDRLNLLKAQLSSNLFEKIVENNLQKNIRDKEGRPANLFPL